MNTVGIDIGGTQLRVGVFDSEHKQVATYKTANDPMLAAQENVDKLIDFITGYGDEIAGIGIGCPGPLDIRSGKILTPPNLTSSWDNFEIAAYVEEKTGIRSVLNNDANVAGLAEARMGAGKGFESVAYITLSTGVGGAYIYKGELINGAHSNAAEFWTMLVNDDPHYHEGAMPGTLNEQASGSGLARIASLRLKREVTTQELFELYHANVDAAVGVVNRSADAMARGIANIACTIDPDVYVIGGGVAIHQPDYVDLIIEHARNYVLGPEYLNVKMAEFGDDAGLLGASLLV